MKTISKINKKDFLLFLIIMPFLKPYNVTLIPTIDNIFKIWKILSASYIMCVFLSRKFKLYIISFILSLFCIFWMISLIVNSGPITDYGNNILSILGCMLLFEINKNNEKFKKRISKIMYKIGAAYMIFNCITAWIGHPFFAAGMKLDDNANFLGGDNYSAFILIVLAGLMFFYDTKYLNKIRLSTWFFTIVGLVSLIIPFAFTGLICYIFLLILVLCDNYKFVKTFFCWKNILLVCATVLLLISYFNLDILFGDFLGRLNKTGFNGRNMIWPMAIEEIKNKIILGHGGLTSQQAATWIIAGANHTHNILLEFPFSTGIIGTMLFIIYFYLLLKGTSKDGDRGMGILLKTLSAFILCSTFDFYIGLIYMYILFNFIWINKRERGNLGKRYVW